MIHILFNISDHGPQKVIKDDQWLGVTVQSQGPGGYVMVRIVQDF